MRMAPSPVCRRTNLHRPDYFEYHSLLELPRVRVSDDQERLRPAVARMPVGEIAIGPACLRHQTPANLLLGREVVVEGDDVLLGVLFMEQQGGGDPQRQLLTEAPGGIGRDKSVGRTGAPAPGIAQPVVAERVRDMRAQS